MTESEYIRTANRVKVSTALVVLRDVLTGDDYGISQDELGEITKRLADAEERLFSITETQEDS